MTIRNEPPKEERLYGDDIWRSKFAELQAEISKGIAAINERVSSHWDTTEKMLLVLDARLEALEGKQAPVESEPVVDKPWPQVGDDYSVLMPCGDRSYFTWEDCAWDKDMLARGSVFRFEKDLEKADTLNLAMQELREGSENEWLTQHQHLVIKDCSKWHFFYNYHMKAWEAICNQDRFIPGAVYFPDKKSGIEIYKYVDAKYPGTIR